MLLKIEKHKNSKSYKILFCDYFKTIKFLSIFFYCIGFDFMYPELRFSELYNILKKN